MGAGIQRWWSRGSYVSECEAYDRKKAQLDVERENPFYLTQFLSREEVEKMFPHPRADEGFELLCVAHGIYGRRDRGDKCGPCRRSEALMMSDGVFELQPDPKPMRIGSADVVSPTQETLDRLNGWFSKKYAPIVAAEARADRDAAASIVAAINTPPDPVRVEQFRKTMKGGTILLASTPAGPSTVFDGIEFVVDERLGPGEHYLLQKSTWRDAVNPNKESNVAKATEAEMKVAQSISVDPSGVREGDAIFLGGVKFVAMPKGVSVGLDMAEPTIAGKVENVQRAIAAGMLPSGSAAKKVYEALTLPQTHTLLPCAHCNETMECEPLLLADGRRMHPGCWADIDPTQPLDAATDHARHFAAHQRMRGGLSPDNIVINEGNKPARRKGLAAVLDQPGQMFHMPIPTGEEAFAQGFSYAGAPKKVESPCPKRMCSGCRKEIGPYAAAQVFDGCFFHEECGDDAGMPVRDSPRFFARQHPTMNAVELIDSTCETMPVLVAYELLASAMVSFRTKGGEEPTERIGDQLRKCHCCEREQKVDRFNLSVEPHKFVGPFGDAENMYICDGCVPEVLKAVNRVKEGKARSSDIGEYDLLPDA